MAVVWRWWQRVCDRYSLSSLLAASCASDGCGLSTPPAAPHSAVPLDDDAERSRLVCFLCQQSGICQKGCAANGSCHASSQPLRWQKDRNDMYDTTSAMYSQLHHGVKYIHSSIVSGAADLPSDASTFCPGRPAPPPWPTTQQLPPPIPNKTGWFSATSVRKLALT